MDIERQGGRWLDWSTAAAGGPRCNSLRARKTSKDVRDSRRGFRRSTHLIVSRAESERHQGVVFSRGDGEAPGVVDGNLFLFDALDLASYVPTSELPLSDAKASWPGDRIESDRGSLHRDYLVLAGFPARFSRVTGFGGGGMTSEAMVYGAVMRYREQDVSDAERDVFAQDLPDYPFLPAECLEPHEFAIHFDAAPEMFLGPESDDEDARNVEDWLGTFEQGETPPGGRTFGVPQSTRHGAGQPQA